MKTKLAFLAVVCFCGLTFASETQRTVTAICVARTVGGGWSIVLVNSSDKDLIVNSIALIKTRPDGSTIDAPKHRWWEHSRIIKSGDIAIIAEAKSSSVTPPDRVLVSGNELELEISVSFAKAILPVIYVEPTSQLLNPPHGGIAVQNRLKTG